MAYYSFGENLKHYRQKKDISAKELARRLNVTPVTIWTWENAVRYPGLNTVYDIANAIGVDVRLLLDPDSNWID